MLKRSSIRHLSSPCRVLVSACCDMVFYESRRLTSFVMAIVSSLDNRMLQAYILSSNLEKTATKKSSSRKLEELGVVKWIFI